MANWRSTGTPCPIDERLIDVNICAECRFFRGASTFHEVGPTRTGRFTMQCNWPRDGSYDALAGVPMPKWMSAIEDLLT